MEKYVQICLECGTKYFMDDPSQRKIVCDECGKRSIRVFEPMRVQDVKEDPGVKKDPIKNTEPEEPGKGAGSSEG
jgi:DNA-directed RNA polymerase subunit RPC12/RpoP